MGCGRGFFGGGREGEGELRLFFLEAGEGRFELVVGAVLRFDVVVDAVDFLNIEGRDWYSGRHTRRDEKLRTFWNVSINSPIGLSARYLTLFQLKFLRYWSTGSEARQHL